MKITRSNQLFQNKQDVILKNNQNYVTGLYTTNLINLKYMGLQYFRSLLTNLLWYPYDFLVKILLNTFLIRNKKND